MAAKLSIGIPTYNREKQLEHQLKCILSQDLSNLEEIIIVDNNSTYNIEGLIKSLDCPKIKLEKTPFNIKMATNMEMPFLYCKTEWLWLLSDDDEVLPDSINKIINEINSCHQNTGMIKFSIDRSQSLQKEEMVNTLEEYIDYYYNEKQIRRGELVFISTNVYNVKKLSEYLGSAFEFSYTYIGFLIPVFLGLNEDNISVKFSSKPVVKFIPPREGWYSFGMVGKGLSTLSHIPLNLTEKYWKKFMSVTMSITHIGQMVSCLKMNDRSTVKDFKIIYNNIYRYYLPTYTKVGIRLFFILISNKLGRLMLTLTKKMLNKIRS